MENISFDKPRTGALLLRAKEYLREPNLQKIQQRTGLSVSEMLGDETTKVLILGRKDQSVGISDRKNIVNSDIDFLPRNLAYDLTDVEDSYVSHLVGTDGAYTAYVDVFPSKETGKDISALRDRLIELERKIGSMSLRTLRTTTEDNTLTNESQVIKDFARETSDIGLKSREASDNTQELKFIDKSIEACTMLSRAFDETVIQQRIADEKAFYDDELRSQGYKEDEIFEKSDLMTRILMQKYLGQKKTEHSEAVSALFPELPFASSTFDKVILPNVIRGEIMHDFVLDDYEQIFDEIFRVLNNDGEAFIFPVQNDELPDHRYNRDLFLGVLETLVAKNKGKFSWELRNTEDIGMDEVLVIKKTETPTLEVVLRAQDYMKQVNEKNKKINANISKIFQEDFEAILDKNGFRERNDGSKICRCLLSPHLLADDSPILFLPPYPEKLVNRGKFVRPYIHEDLYYDLQDKAQEFGEDTRKAIMERVKYQDFIQGYIALKPVDGTLKRYFKYDRGDMPRVFRNSGFLNKLKLLYGIDGVEDISGDTDIQKLILEANTLENINKNAKRMKAKDIAISDINKYKRLALQLYIEGSLKKDSVGWEFVQQLEKEMW